MGHDEKETTFRTRYQLRRKLGSHGDSATGGGTADRGFVSSAQKKAAALYTQAGDYQKTARFYYKKAEDTYYQANNWAAYDDWRRARDQWDYFYSRNR